MLENGPIRISNRIIHRVIGYPTLDVMQLLLENGPIRISKRIIHRVTGYPTLDREKTLRSNAKEVIENNSRAIWNKREILVGTIEYPIIAS